ncbi:MAG: ABC transporter permease [Rhodospirillales bacterium]|nr:ABC transporter permease [Rhodospirillales bacterium]
MNGWAFFLRKAGRALLTLWLVVTFVFVVLRVSGDPVELLLPDDTPQHVLDHYRHAWGLDQPLYEQYVRYIASVAAGDLGQSFRDGRPALEVVLERVPVTLQLGFAALVVTVALGMPLGITAAFNRNNLIDRLTVGASVIGYSLPNFFLGILLILTFALSLRVLPSSGYGSFKHLLMPALTLGTALAGIVARFTRSSVLEVLSQPYIRAARAKGVSSWRLVSWHALPNAAIPVVTILGFQVGNMLGGALVTESVFAWPGVGRLLVQSVAVRDLAIVQTCVLLIAVMMVATNLVVDTLYGWLDPRVRLAAPGGKAR